MFDNVLIAIDGRQGGRDAIALAKQLAGPNASFPPLGTRPTPNPHSLAYGATVLPVGARGSPSGTFSRSPECHSSAGR